MTRKSKRPTSLQVTDALANLPQCEHMLIYLTSATWTSGAASAAFADDVCKALRHGVHLLLVYESLSLVDDDPRGACTFDDMWNEGWTPKHLLTGEANIYKQIAIALKPGAWRKAGLATVIRKMSDGGGERTPIGDESLLPAAWRLPSPEVVPTAARSVTTADGKLRSISRLRHGGSHLSRATSAMHILSRPDRLGRKRSSEVNAQVPSTLQDDSPADKRSATAGDADVEEGGKTQESPRALARGKDHFSVHV